MAWPPAHNAPYDPKKFETSLWIKESLVKNTRRAIEKNRVALENVPDILNKLEPKRYDIDVIAYLNSKKRFVEALEYIAKVLDSMSLQHELVERYSKFFSPESIERVEAGIRIFKGLNDVIYSCWENPTVGLLEAQLEREVSRENYENAAKLKEQIRKMTTYGF